MKSTVFFALFGSWFALVQAGQMLGGFVNWLLLVSCLLVLTPVVQGRHPFSS